ncbi:hypothetical protein EV122DRAFT_278850 [Schizophyllum commune]
MLTTDWRTFDCKNDLARMNDSDHIDTLRTRSTSTSRSTPWRRVRRCCKRRGLSEQRADNSEAWTGLNLRHDAQYLDCKWTIIAYAKTPRECAEMPREYAEKPSEPPRPAVGRTQIASIARTYTSTSLSVEMTMRGRRGSLVAVWIPILDLQDVALRSSYLSLRSSSLTFSGRRAHSALVEGLALFNFALPPNLPLLDDDASFDVARIGSGCGSAFRKW